MWITITRQARGTRAAASRGSPRPASRRSASTRRNNAYIVFQEKEIGSLEAGKFADLIVLDRDVMTCPIDDFKETKVLQTYLGGKVVYQR